MKDGTVCKTCTSGYTLISSACTVNIANCNEMNTATDCKTCAAGYYGTKCT